jgi:hypothetical protein
LRKLIGIFFTIVGIIIGLYVGGWLMFIHPIISACKALDSHTLTGYLVGITLLKCIFASVVGSVIALIGIVIRRFIIKD